MAPDRQFQRHMERLEGLLAQVDSFTDPAAAEKTRQIIQDLMDFHGTALAQLLDHLKGSPVLDALAQDPLVSTLLLLYNLHPLDLPTRVGRALDKVRPYLATHHGNVELLEITADGIVRLSLRGSCHGCPSSRATLKGTIEEALYAAAPDIAAIEVEGAVDETPPAPDAFVALSDIRYQGCPLPAAGIAT